MSDNLKLLCGLWKCQGPKGEYLRGKTQHSFIVDAGHTLLVFANLRRTKDSQPHFYLYSAPPREGGSEGKAGGGGLTGSQSGEESYADTHKVGSPPEGGKAGGGDDVPF